MREQRCDWAQRCAARVMLLGVIVLVQHVVESDAFSSVDYPYLEDMLAQTDALDPRMPHARSAAGKTKIESLKAKYASSLDTSSTSWIVITSINPPTRQVQRICGVKGWNVVIVGDKKSPDDAWQASVRACVCAHSVLQIDYMVLAY